MYIAHAGHRLTPLQISSRAYVSETTVQKRPDHIRTLTDIVGRCANRQMSSEPVRTATGASWQPDRGPGHHGHAIRHCSLLRSHARAALLWERYSILRTGTSNKVPISRCVTFARIAAMQTAARVALRLTTYAQAKAAVKGLPHEALSPTSCKGGSCHPAQGMAPDSCCVHHQMEMTAGAVDALSCTTVPRRIFTKASSEEVYMSSISLPTS